MKQVLNVLLLSLIIVGTACSRKTDLIIKDQTIGVLSYNIHHANPPSMPDSIDLGAIARVIVDSGAELIALQEVDVNTLRSGKSLDQAEELGKLTGMNVSFSKGIDY